MVRKSLNNPFTNEIMKKNYTVPQSTVLESYPEESVLLQTSNALGNGEQLSNKREYEDENAFDGSHAWSSDSWGNEGEK